MENGFQLKKHDTSQMLVLKEDNVQTQEQAWDIVLIGLIVRRFIGLQAFNELRSSWNVPSKYYFHELG